MTAFLGFTPRKIRFWVNITIILIEVELTILGTFYHLAIFFLNKKHSLSANLIFGTWEE